MKKKFENGLFIFRRDLRIIDNVGLNMLSSLCENIYTIFIFTKEQVSDENKYKSNASVQFMLESLICLQTQIEKQDGKLYCYYGKNEIIVKNCIDKFNINIVGFNLDCTPYARNRDTAIVKLCNKLNVSIVAQNDYYLNMLGSILTTTGTPYKKFTPYYDSAKKIRVELPSRKKQINFKLKYITNMTNYISIDDATTKFININNPNMLVHGGRKYALQLLLRAKKDIYNYDAIHNDLSKQTSLLSASIKFGCISIREVYHSLKHIPGLIRQLYWREFYANIMYSFPHVLGHSLQPKYNSIKWEYNAEYFTAFCNGKTGYPIVDAGIRQMLATGYMHNRARLIVASFLIKILQIDWKKGEEFFAANLVDYDVANNNGNWQWVSGGGADSQPYFRVFNPYRQTENYDSNCKYIKQWVPELNDVPNNDILKWDIKYINYSAINYPKPIVDYKKQKEKTLKMYLAAI